MEPAVNIIGHTSAFSCSIKMSAVNCVYMMCRNATESKVKDNREKTHHSFILRVWTFIKICLIFH